ncbi:MAG: undecaprenyl-diphosphate phosphatase [Candidatus Pacebacteria bacterium]|nr:undecaprenyl-diphosphate phosphatase [Candidatus Paceibacterota bacterium]
MTSLHALILGIVEGFTEFLPISSTGHLILASRLLGVLQTDFVKSFEIIIQLGAILAVLVVYGRRVMGDFQALKKILAAFIPTAIIGLVLYKLIKQYLIGNDTVVLWSLLIGGIVIILFEIYFGKKPEEAESSVSEVTYGQAVVVGLAQAIAVIPGVSRSAATIIGGRLVGISKKTIVEFSFLLAVPTMIAASALDIYKNPIAFHSSDSLALLVGFVSSFVVALLSIKWLLAYIQRHNFIAFGIYRIVISLFFFWLFFR